MKAARIVILLVVLYACKPSLTTHCDTDPVNINSTWAIMNQNQDCVKQMKAQVEIELNAALTYMTMAAHFSRDKINRPGFAKMFFESANEEREHAIKIIDYLLMRGELSRDMIGLIHNPFSNININEETLNGKVSLETALDLESKVTQKIIGIIKACEGNNANDYHLVDYLSGEFLEEQFQGQRDLAGKISILGKMQGLHGYLGEYLFDKKLLNGELPVIG